MMTNADAVFAGSIPEFYDTYMVPLIFEVYAADLAARVGRLAPMTVLETAAGTGVVLRAVTAHLHPEARYVVTDLNEPMLAFAATRQAADPRISWQQADALALPFGDRTFDLVLCQFGAMFFPDRAQGYAEARRVLKDGGHFIFSVWDRIENNLFTDVVTQAVATVFPDDPPRFMARTPHGYYDHDIIRADLNRAGFTTIDIDTLEATSSAPSAHQAAMALCQGTPLRREIEARDPDSLDHVTQVAAAALEARFGKETVAGKIRAHIVTAVR
jgi:ubiquinone/menaquinone biosynthesis C-methylase UbiE